MKKELICTFLSEAFVLLCGLLVYRLAKYNLGDEGFAVYALCRRSHSLLAPALLIGCAVAIPRFIAYRKETDVSDADSYFRAGMLQIAATAAIFIVVLNTFSKQLAGLLFGDRSFFYLSFPLSIMMIGYLLHALCYAYYRGYNRILVVNVLQVLNMALIPILAMCFATSTTAVLTWTGLGWSVSAGTILMFGILPNLSGTVSKDHLGKLFSFGFQRLPADLGLAALFGLPAMFTANTAGVVAGGHVAFSISLLNMCGAAFAPIGLVLLPKASAALARKDSVLVSRYISVVLVASIVASSCLLVVFEIAAYPILNIYLGSSVEPELIVTAKVAVLATVPYAIYVGSRSLIDAYFAKAVNTFGILLALALFLGLSLESNIFDLNLITPIGALVAALYLLGSVALLACWRIKHLIASSG